jgi:hypothetical protein
LASKISIGIKKLVDWLELYISLSLIGSVIGGAMLSFVRISKLFGLKEEDHLVLLQWIACIGFFLLLIGLISQSYEKAKVKLEKVKSEEKVKEQETIIDNLQKSYKKILAHTLFEIASKLKLSSTERISLYLHDDQGYFILLARYSDNPTFQQAGRVIYSDKQGCIQRGWENGFFMKQNFPDFNTNPDKYVAIHSKDFSMDETTVKNLTMMSRSVICKSLKDGATSPKAILLIESTLKDKFDEKEVKKIITSEQPSLLKFLEDNSPFTPEINKAIARGL